MTDTYVARKRLKVGTTVYEPGDEVPEASHWRTLPSYVNSGAVALVQTTHEQAYGVNQQIPTEPDALKWEHADNRVLHLPHMTHPWGKDVVDIGPEPEPEADPEPPTTARRTRRATTK
jgi:hypothetical protein